MENIILIISTYAGISTIQLRHKNDNVVVCQKLRNKAHFPLRGIIKALFKLYKLKRKRGK